MAKNEFVKLKQCKFSLPQDEKEALDIVYTNLEEEMNKLSTRNKVSDELFEILKVLLKKKKLIVILKGKIHMY